MATLATLFHRIVGPSVYAQADSRAARSAEDTFVLRPIPNQEIYFYVKQIDNSRVVRESDPAQRNACWKLIVSAGATAILLIGVLLPSAYGLLAGYQIQALKQEQTRLMTERSVLELEEARLLSPARLEELAKIQSFIDPAPQKVVYLENGKGSMAMNVKK